MTPDERARARASARDGIIDRAGLRAAGLTDRQIQRRVRNGQLIRHHNGVFRVAGAPLSFRARVQAALLAAGSGAFASHRTAAVLWGIRRGEPERVEVTVIGRRHVRLAGVRVHRVVRGPAPETRARDGIRLSAPGRTICELAGSEPREEVEYAVQEAAARLRFTPGELQRAADRWGARHGRAMLRSILQQEPGGELTRSWAERRLIRIVDGAGLPRPVTNIHILGHRVDAVWQEARLIVEVDGIGTHGTAVAFDSDRAHDAELTAAGWRVLRFTRRQLKEQPMLVAARIAQALAHSWSS